MVGAFTTASRLAAVAALVVLTTAAQADYIRIGDWRLGDYIGDDTGFALTVFNENVYKDKNDVRDISVHCRKDQWVLIVLAICQKCDPSRHLPLRVSIDGNVAFDVPASIADYSFVMSDPKPPEPGGGYYVEVVLSSGQLQVLSQIKRSITVEAPGYRTISLQPRQGTVAAFQTLQTMCKATRSDPTLRSE